MQFEVGDVTSGRECYLRWGTLLEVRSIHEEGNII